MAYLMKGHSWQDRKHKVQYPVYVEPKVDEIRCRVKYDAVTQGVKFLSYAEKPLHNLQGFSQAFRQLFLAYPAYLNFDLGVLVNDNFNDTYRWVRSSRGIPPDLDLGMVRFILFDLPDSRVPYRERRTYLHPVAAEARLHGLRMAVSVSYVAKDEVSVIQAYEYFRGLGHEGAMVKDPGAVYAKGKRTDAWLKLKPENTADGRIVAVHQAISIEGDPLDRAGSVTVKMEDGSLGTPHGIPHALGRAMLADPQKYIGEWVEFKFMHRDRAGGYRHPVWGRFREAKQ